MTLRRILALAAILTVLGPALARADSGYAPDGDSGYAPGGSGGGDAPLGAVGEHALPGTLHGTPRDELPRDIAEALDDLRDARQELDEARLELRKALREHGYRVPTRGRLHRRERRRGHADRPAERRRCHEIRRVIRTERGEAVATATRCYADDGDPYIVRGSRRIERRLE